jgi:acetyltransferase
MDKLFYPESIALFGLSANPNNIPKAILENMLRWGYLGRIFGVNPKVTVSNVDGIKMYKQAEDLPIVPHLAVILIPAQYVPETVENCGKFGIKNIAILSGGFNEYSQAGRELSERITKNAKKYGVRFVGPNCVGVANTVNGVCLPFQPLFRPPQGGLSIITQSGGIGLFLWNLMSNENVGLAKYVSIGNKLDLDEVDFLEYFGRDSESKVIALYLESISRGRELVEAAVQIDKPILILKANTTQAGKKAAMSHTAAISNDEDIVDSAFERAGIIRINNYSDFISITKGFDLPPMKGKRLMVMSPAGGMAVHMADLSEKAGFEFADPGVDFYEGLQEFSNAGVINFSNPLDMGDIYDPKMHAHIFYSVLHNKNVDGAVYVTQRPRMPREDDIFYRIFHTDISKETFGAIQSSGKPLGVCLYGPADTIMKIKKNLTIPLFNTPEEMIFALKAQADYYAFKAQPLFETQLSDGFDIESIERWIEKNDGVIGEAALEMLFHCGLPVAESYSASNPEEAVKYARHIGYPVVMKVISPDAVHKSEVGGIIINLSDDNSVRQAFDQIQINLLHYKKDAQFDGVRVMQMVSEGMDMFIGGTHDNSFGPVAFFGYGGIYIEVFNDVQSVLCPSNHNEIEAKVLSLKAVKILQGIRGKAKGDILAFINAIERISHLMARFPVIKELDINPLRVLNNGSGVIALDARIRLEKNPFTDS